MALVLSMYKIRHDGGDLALCMPCITVLLILNPSICLLISQTHCSGGEVGTTVKHETTKLIQQCRILGHFGKFPIDNK